MRCFIADSHTDFMTAVNSKKQREEYVKFCAQTGVKILGCAIFTTEYNFTIDNIIQFKNELQILSNKYNIKLLLCIEDLGFITTMQDLERLIALKPFSISLTWNYLNQYAGGANTSQGLTALGKKVVKMLEENKILVDTAHLSNQAFEDLIKITTLPIFNSHSNVCQLYPHNRNLTNKQIYQIMQSGGYLGVTIYSRFLSNHQITSKDVANQFDYLVNKFGVDYFGFGSDLYGFDLKYSPIDVKTYAEFGRVAEHLNGLGYNDDNISKLMYVNLERFVKKLQSNKIVY